MRYLDTSVLVAAFTNEIWSEFVYEWLLRQPKGSLSISWWVDTEFAAALSQKIRRGEMTNEERVDAKAQYGKIRQASFLVLDVIHTDFETAARLADQHEAGLRASDALHLAIAARNDALLCTLDHGLDAAGVALEIATLFVGHDKALY